MLQTLRAREIILGILVIYLLLQITNGKVILCMIIVGIYYLSDYKNINKSVTELFMGITNKDEKALSYMNKSRKNKLKLHQLSGTHPDIIKHLNKLKRYRKYNKISYDKGYNLMIQYIYMLRNIQKDIPHSRDLYDNAEVTYKSAIKEFQSLSVSVPSYGYTQSISRPEEHHRMRKDYSEKIGDICKELNDICYYLLYNLSLQINADWVKNPSTNKSEIIQSDIEPGNSISYNHVF